MADCRKDWRKSKNAFCLQRTNFTIFHYADDTNELGFRTDSERSAELIKFRTEPIPKKFLHSVPNRTEIWKSIPQTPTMNIYLFRLFICNFKRYAVVDI